VNSAYSDQNRNNALDSDKKLAALKTSVNLLEEYNELRCKIKRELTSAYDENRPKSKSLNVDMKLSEKLADISSQIETSIMPFSCEYSVILDVIKHIKVRRKAKQMKSNKPSIKGSHLRNISFNNNSLTSELHRKCGKNKKKRIFSNDRVIDKLPLVQSNFKR